MQIIEGTGVPSFVILILSLVEKITELVKSHLESPEFFIVEIKAAVGTGKQKVLVLLDGDEGITIEQCAFISRKLANDIEEMDLIKDAFNLEVSSPGLDTPLMLPRQYEKNVGRRIKVILEDSKEFKGELLNVVEENILIKEEYKEKGKKKILYKETAIPFSEIKKTNVLVTFK